jgi:hypothetical protein
MQDLNSGGPPDRTAGEASDPDESRWVSYAELAKARAISRLSAERLVRKKRWPKRTGNDKTIRVLVPAHELMATAEGRPSNRPDALPALMQALDLLKAQLAREVARADAAEAQLADARDGEMRSALAAATATEALRQADAREQARRAMRRWQRLRAAWQGG